MTFIKQRKRTKTLKELCLAITFTLIVLSFLTATSICPPPLTLDIHGQVYIDGTKAFAGLNVSARIGGVIVSSLLTNGTGYYGILSINDTYFGEVISLYVEDVFGQNTTFDGFGPRRIDLTITDTEPPSQPTGLTHTSPITDNTPSFSWTASTDNLAVRGYYVNITGYSTYFTSGISWESPDVIVDCNHTINVWATDYANLNSTTASLNFTIDAAAPTVIIIAPTTASPIYTQTPTTVYVSYNYTEGHPKNATITIHNATHTIGQTTITTLAAGTNINRNDSVAVAAAADGTYNVTATIYDIADHSSADEEADAVIIDSTPPVVSITYPAEGECIDTVPIIWINGTVTEASMGTNQPMINDTAAFNLHHFNSTTGEFAFYNTTVIPDCTHSYTVNFTDLAGNTGYDTVTFTIDTVYPIVEITYPTDGHYFDSESVYWINGTFLEKNPNLTMPLVINHTGFILADWTWNSTTYEGTFAFKNNTVIADCHYHVMVTLTDLAGKSASDIVYFHIDTTKPIVTITFPTDDYYFDSEAVIWINGTFTEKNFNITGLLDINHTGFILADWTWNSTTYEGTFSFKNSTYIAEGLQSVAVSFTDLAGNTGEATVNFTRDTTYPVVVITYPTEGAYLSVSTLWVNGTVVEENIGTLEPSINDTRFGLTFWNGTHFAFQNSTAIPDCTHSVAVNFTDLAGKTGSDTVYFILDTTAPTEPTDLTWTSPTNDSTPSFSWTASIDNKAIKGYYVNIIGYPTYYLGNVTGWTSPDLIGDCNHTINVWATDLANNNGTVASLDFTIDTTAPIVILIAPRTASPIYVQTPTTIYVTYNYTDLHPKNATIRIHNATHTIGQTTITLLAAGTNINRNDSVTISAAADGAYNVTVTIFDKGGQSEGQSDYAAVIIDNTLPVVNITYPAEGEYLDGIAVIWINGTVTELNRGALEPSMNDTSFTLAYWDSATGQFGFENNTAIPDGPISVEVSFTDLAGNTGSDSVTFTLDTLAPVLVITYPTDGAYLDDISTIWVNGTVTELNIETLEPSINDTRFTLAYWDVSTGTFGFQNITYLPDCTYVVAVSFTDLAGNTGEATVTFTLDTTAPIVAIAYPTEGAYVTISPTIWVNGTVTELNKDALEPAINDTRFDLAHWDSATGAFAFLNNTMISEGKISVEVNFTDLAGKTGLDTVTFTVLLKLQLEGAKVWYWVNDTTITFVVEGDVDADGLTEIVTGGYYYDGTREVAQLVVWNSTLGLEGVTAWYRMGNTTITSVAIGDVDGDGGMEIVTAGCYHDGVRKVAQLAVWNGTTLSLENVTVWYWVGDTCINSVAIGDIDADGRTEIVTAGYYHDGNRSVAQLAVWDGPTLSLERATDWYWVNDTSLASVAVGDVDGDYSDEIVTGGYYYDGTRDVAQLVVWNSTLGLEGVTVWHWVGDTHINSVAIGDVDGDSFTEIVTGGYYQSGVKVAQLATWDGATLSLEKVTFWSWIGDTTINSVAIGDVDGDGLIEIVTGGSYHDGTYDSAQLVVWSGSDLTLEAVTVWRWTGDTTINSVALGDVDGDGDIELVTGGSYHDGTRTIAQLTVWAVTG